jgi:hypothetical protein
MLRAVSRWTRLHALAWVIALPTGACASRQVPVESISASAASIHAASSRPADVTVALREDPPLPGDESALQRWPGLRESAATPPPAEPKGEEKHEHQHTHDAAPPPSMTPPLPSNTPPGDAKAQYWCPMHKDVVSDAPGRCPKCRMSLVRKP